MKKGAIKKIAWGLLIAVVFSVLVSLMLIFGLFRGSELKSLDFRFRWRGPQDVSHSDLIIVAIDQQTFTACRDRYHYPREYYATLIDNLNEVGIRRIMFDIQFTEPDMKNPLGDSILADAVRRNENIILAGKIDRVQTPAGIYAYPNEPIPVLLETGREWGVVGELQDPDGFLRRYSIFESYQNNKFIYTIGSKVLFAEKGVPGNAQYSFNNGYFTFKDSTGEEVIRLLGHRSSLGFEQTFLINYYGPAGTIPTYSMSSVLDDADFDLRDEEDTDYMELFKKNSVYPYELRLALLSDSTLQMEAFTALALGDTASVDAILDQLNPFKDKIALIGVSIEELHDNKYTPYYNYGGVRMLMPGVETHAHAIQTMLDGNFIKTLPFYQNIIIIFVIGIITSLIVSIVRPALGGLFSAVLAGAYVAGLIWIFIEKNTWIYMIPVVVIILVSYVSNVVYQFISEQKEKKKIRGMFQTYMSPKVLKYLEDHPDAFSLSGEKREATMFFSDVADFTTISESLSAEELSIVLNKYLSPMTDILMSYDGYVDKYEGDAIMCDFGVPMEDPDHAWKACFATLDQQAALVDIRKEIKKAHGVDIYVRMGVNSGIVSAGNMGSAQRFQYTVMGDAVNQASRFEGANKQYGSYMMIGEETHKRAKDKIEVRILDRLVVKGKLIPITVYELMAKKGELTNDQSLIQAYFTKGIELYWDRQWDEAIEQFQQSINVTGDDPPSKVFIRRCKIFKENPPGDDWQGEFIMTTK
ncbi:MAG: adenylate/guanylate cyclase domain-containing protein [Candidatus Marinimicrobia bacterium]|nr:adenylate/guanylate cyclase domain-containing protein [Candidatus Neomarinimicrobiota bacterium]